MISYNYSTHFSAFSIISQTQKVKTKSKDQSQRKPKMAHRNSYPMDKQYAPAPLRLFKARDTHPLNTLSNCTNEECKHDLSTFDLPPPNCPMCGNKTSTAPPLPPAGPGWGFDYHTSGVTITEDGPAQKMEIKGYGDGAEGDGNVFCIDGQLGLGMDQWTRKDWEDRGMNSRIEKWRKCCGEEECKGYFVIDASKHHTRSSWDGLEKIFRDNKVINDGKVVRRRPQATSVLNGKPSSRPEMQAMKRPVVILKRESLQEKIR